LVVVPDFQVEPMAVRTGSKRTSDEASAMWLVSSAEGLEESGSRQGSPRGVEGQNDTLEANPTGSEQDPLRGVDTQLLRALGDGRTRGVGELIESLGVTATAVRQRLERVLAAGLIERQKMVSGRGRPSFEYRLTDKGRWCAGADPADLARAMWFEILDLGDDALRGRILSGIARRLGEGLTDDYREPGVDGVDKQVNVVRGGAVDESDGVVATERASGVVPTGSRVNRELAERMRKVGHSLAKRRIVTRVELASDGGRPDLPVLDLPSCPYPALRDATHDRLMCELERRMLSEAIGNPVELSSCVLDGDPVCRFTPAVGSVPRSGFKDSASG
jgi:predicted ArsR family transcriptional regulator